MSNLNLIASTTLLSNTASVVISDIPATFEDLLITVVGRSTWTTDQYEDLNVRMNGDTGSNYSSRFLGYGIYGTTYTNQTNFQVGRLNVSQSSNIVPSIFEVRIPEYANTSMFKTTIGTSSASNSAYGNTIIVGLWRSTAAINSLTFRTGQTGSNIAAGATFNVYGLR